MATLISVLMAVALSLLITRVGAEAFLTLAGLSRTSANFQAVSTFLVRVPLRLAPTRGRTALLALVLPQQNQRQSSNIQYGDTLLCC